MKKLYETPSAEKIAFRYRDQVVAASGDVSDPQSNGSSSTIGNGKLEWSDVEEIWGRLAQPIGLC